MKGLRLAAEMAIRNRHLVLVPVLIVFCLFSIAVVLENSVADDAKTPAFGYRMF